MLVVLTQIGLALAYYVGLVIITRLAGKRLAGQVTTFDLIVLISLGVVLQQIVLLEGKLQAFTFIVTVFLAHRGLAVACSRSRRLRRLVRGAPRPIIRDGQVDHTALEDEGVSQDDLLAGLRKLGHDDPRHVRLATLEETGHISVVPMDTPSGGEESGSGRK